MSKALLDRAIAKSMKDKKVALDAAKPAPDKTTLSAEQLQFYVDMMLDAAIEPEDRLQQAMLKSGELTEKLIREKYAVV